MLPESPLETGPLPGRWRRDRDGTGATGPPGSRSVSGEHARRTNFFTRFRTLFQGGLEDLLDSPKRFRVHPLNSRRNQALERAHQRLVVAGEMPMTSLVSARVKPPKNLSSTSWACFAVQLGKSPQGLVQRQEIDGSSALAQDLVDQGDCMLPAAPLLGHSRPRPPPPESAAWTGPRYPADGPCPSNATAFRRVDEGTLHGPGPWRVTSGGLPGACTSRPALSIPGRRQGRVEKARARFRTWIPGSDAPPPRNCRARTHSLPPGNRFPRRPAIRRPTAIISAAVLIAVAEMLSSLRKASQTFLLLSLLTSDSPSDPVHRRLTSASEGVPESLPGDA